MLCLACRGTPQDTSGRFVGHYHHLVGPWMPDPRAFPSRNTAALRVQAMRRDNTSHHEAHKRLPHLGHCSLTKSQRLEQGFAGAESSRPNGSHGLTMQAPRMTKSIEHGCSMDLRKVCGGRAPPRTLA